MAIQPLKQKNLVIKIAVRFNHEKLNGTIEEVGI
jgi:hypothetical protein